MPRLRCAPPRLATTPNRLGTGATAGTGFSRTDGRSAAARGYDASWRRLRLSHLLAHPLCAQCERDGRQAEFALGFGALAAMRALYSGVMAVLQIPAGHLAERLGGRFVLVAGTFLSAAGYAIAGMSGSLFGLCAALAIGGAGSATQHPLASAAVSYAYGGAARGPLGTYNFAGDLGKAVLPAGLSVLLTFAAWRPSMWLLAALGVITGVAGRMLLPVFAARARTRRRPAMAKDAAGLGCCWPSACSTAASGGLPDLPALLAAGQRG